LALLTATAYEDEFADTLTDKDSPFAAVHELIEEVMAAAAEARGNTGLDLRLTVRVPFVALLSAAIFGAPVFSGTAGDPPATGSSTKSSHSPSMEPPAATRQKIVFCGHWGEQTQLRSNAKTKIGWQ
jgi:hypothetical protein